MKFYKEAFAFVVGEVFNDENGNLAYVVQCVKVKLTLCLVQIELTD